jgi:hypothetical protein
MTYSKSIGEMIIEFENSDKSDVATFNRVFFLSPLDFDSSLTVDIGEPCTNLSRVLYVDDVKIIHDFRPLKSELSDNDELDENKKGEFYE